MCKYCIYLYHPSPPPHLAWLFNQDCVDGCEIDDVKQRCYSQGPLVQRAGGWRVRRTTESEENKQSISMAGVSL